MLEDLEPKSFVDQLVRRADRGTYLILDLKDLFDEMRRSFDVLGEPSDYLDDSVALDAFLQDLFSNICYLEHFHNSVSTIKRQINSVLDQACQYFYIDDFSTGHRRIWAKFTHSLVELFKEHRLYGRDHVHRYDYWSLRDETLKLKLWEQ